MAPYQRAQQPLQRGVVDAAQDMKQRAAAARPEPWRRPFDAVVLLGLARASPDLNSTREPEHRRCRGRARGRQGALRSGPAGARRRSGRRAASAPRRPKAHAPTPGRSAGAATKGKARLWLTDATFVALGGNITRGPARLGGAQSKAIGCPTECRSRPPEQSPSKHILSSRRRHVPSPRPDSRRPASSTLPTGRPTRRRRRPTRRFGAGNAHPWATAILPCTALATNRGTIPAAKQLHAGEFHCRGAAPRPATITPPAPVLRVPTPKTITNRCAPRAAARYLRLYCTEASSSTTSCLHRRRPAPTPSASSGSEHDIEIALQFETRAPHGPGQRTHGPASTDELRPAAAPRSRCGFTPAACSSSPPLMTSPLTHTSISVSV